MSVDRGSHPLTYGQIVVRVSLATLPLAAISIAGGLFLGYGSGFTALFCMLVCRPGPTTLSSTLYWVCAYGWLVLLFLTGVLATRATGSVPAGTAAGLFVGLISSLVYLAVGGALAGLLYPSTGFFVCDPPCVPPPPSFASVANEIIASLPFSIIALVIGAGCGLLGGLLGLLLHWLRPPRA